MNVPQTLMIVFQMPHALIPTVLIIVPVTLVTLGMVLLNVTYHVSHLLYNAVLVMDLL